MKLKEEDFFPADEAERRFGEVMSRMGGRPPVFDLVTGQNYGEPKLSRTELLRRGYDDATVANLRRFMGEEESYSE